MKRLVAVIFIGATVTLSIPSFAAANAKHEQSRKKTVSPEACTCTPPVPAGMALDEKIAAYCANKKKPDDRAECVGYYSAQPYTYTVHTIPPGNGYTLCERFAENLRAVVEPPSCEVSIHPDFARYFQVVEWEVLDPRQYSDLLYYADAVTANPGDWKLRLPSYSSDHEPWPTKEAWRKRFEAKLADPDQGGLFQPELARAHFDANSDGKPEWMLGYRYRRPCNPWGGSSRSTGYWYFPLKDDRATVDREALERKYQVHDIGLGSRPIATTLKDPRYPNTSIYLLDTAFGLVHAGGWRALEGQTFSLYAAAEWVQGLSPYKACTFELRKQPLTPARCPICPMDSIEPATPKSLSTKK